MAIINGSTVGGMTLQADYSYTQNASANTSTVTVTLKLANHYALYASALSGSYISVGGNKANYTKSISYGGSTTTTTTLATKTVTVAHNSDGTGTCTIGGTFVINGTYRGTYIGTMSVSSTITLPKIARASTISKFTNNNGTTISEIDTGSIFRVYWVAASTAFKYKIQCVAPGGTYTYPNSSTEFLSATAGYLAIQSDHSWLPNQTSHRMEVRLYTYNSAGTQVGSTQMSYITLNVPQSVAPSISSFVVESVDGMNGLSICGKSRVKLTANATPGSGTTMATYTFSGNNVNEADGSSSRTVYNTANSSAINTGVLNYTGAATYTVTVADMRGRKASVSLGIEVFEYIPPAITSMSVQRCNASGSLDENGTYAYVTVNSQYTTLYHNNTNYNSRTIVLTNGTNSFATTVQNTSNTNNSWSGVYGNGTFTTGSTHTITATITDTAYSSSASMSQPLKAAARPMNIKSNGKGIGFGKMAETDGLLDVQWNERVRGNLQVDGTGSIDGMDISKNTYVLGGSQDNITDENWIAGTQSFIGTYSQGNQWYSTISLRHRNGQEDGVNYGMQLRSILTQNDNLSWRQHLGSGNWSDWKTFLDDNNTADRVVEQGTSGVWSWKKWNSGRMEVYGTASHNPTVLSDGVNSFTVTMPVSFVDSSFTVTITPAKCGLLVSAFGDCNSTNGIEHSTNAFVLSYKYNHSPSYTVNFNIMAVGRWK